MADGLSLDPAEFDPGPLATRGQVHTPSGTNIATVVGLTPGSFANVTGPVFFGLNVAGPAAPFFMTATQATAVLNLFTPTLQGLVPASGGGTTNFLRADGNWAPVSAGHGIRDNGVLENQRSNINLLSTTSIIAAAADDAGNDETEMTWQRAALTGAIAAGQNVNATLFSGIQDGGAATTDRTNLNFVDGTNTTAVLTDDAGGDRINIAINVTGIVSSGALTGAVIAAAGGGASTFGGILDNGAAENNRTNLNFLSGTNTTASITDDAGNDELEIRWDWNGLQARRNSGTLLTARRRFNFIEGTSISITVNSDAADDENEVTIAYNGVIPGAVSGAVTHAAGGGNSVFSGIRVNGSATTDRTNLNFENTVDGQWTLVDDAVNDEIEINFTPLGSFYSENNVGSFQTRFVSFDDSTMLDGEVVDNTGGSGFVNVFFELKPQSAARIIGRARGAGLGIPTALTPDQVGSLARFNATEDINVAGIVTDVAIAETSSNVRFSNGGATGIIRSIAAPAEEGQIVFPEMTTAGGDEFIYIHEDTSQTAANRISCPGGRPFRGINIGPPHMLYYAGRSNRWTVIGPVGGQSGAIVEIDEHFDSGTAQTVEGTTPILLPTRNNEFSWAVCGNPLVTGSGGVNAISNELSHRGIWRIDTGTATNDATCIFLARDTITGTIATNEDLYDSDNIQRFACWVRIPTATSVRVIAGFMEDPVNLAGGTEFIGFEADTSGGTSTTNWVLSCRAASVNTNVDTGVAFSTLWHKLEWFRYDEYVIFYVNRVFAGLISTNVPNGGGTIAIRVQTRTTAERFVDVDRVIVEVLEASMD